MVSCKYNNCCHFSLHASPSLVARKEKTILRTVCPMGGEVEQCIHVLRMTLSGPKLDFKVFFTSFLLIYISKDHHRPENRQGEETTA